MRRLTSIHEHSRIKADSISMRRWSKGHGYRASTQLFSVVHSDQLRSAPTVGAALHFAHDGLLWWWGKWVRARVTTEQFDLFNLAGISLYKIGIILFNLVPCIVLYMIG